MKIVAISDTHGLLPTIDVEEYDILCICGDIFPLKAQNNMPQCESWFQKKFIPWCEALPCKHVLLVAGNHDLWFERTLTDKVHSMFTGTKIKYLENDAIEIDGKKFYGTPYCHQFGKWAFMRDDDRLALIFENIPEDLDVLLTHDAPYGTSDMILQNVPWMNGEHIGCIPLRDAVIEKQPKVLLHGHLHSTNHAVEILNETDVFNVSLVDEHYELVYKPLVLSI